MAQKKTQKNQPSVDDLKTPLLAAVGAADLALEAVNELVAALREQAGEARTTASTRADEARERLTKLRENLPKRTEELRGSFTSDELRKVAEDYLEQVQTTYQNLVDRGEAALERLRNQPVLEQGRERVGSYRELTEEALGNVASQTRAVGERAAKLVGVELPAKKTATKKKAPASKAPTKKAVAKKAPAKKAAAKKVTQK